MQDNLYFPISDAVFFEDTLRAGHPYIAEEPRNHESLFFVIKGKVLYEKDGKSQVISQGQVGYIARGSSDVSSAYMCDAVTYYAVNFCFDRAPVPAIGCMPFSTLCSSGDFYYPYATLFKQATAESTLCNTGADYLVNGILMQIIGYLLKETAIHKDNISKHKRVDKALEYIKVHSEDAELRISELSRLVEMSEKNFRRIFKELYQKTPYEFLQEYRLEKAEILLANTNKSVSEIALTCGFSDVYSFSHCFKRHRGISPQSYRAHLHRTVEERR